MGMVRAAVHPHGVTAGSVVLEEREIAEDLPAGVIGECVTEAVHAAWKRGFDPAIDPFVVIVSFR